MPDPQNPSVDIQNVEAEITGAAREAERAIGRPRGSSPEKMARQMRELMARETWRVARLSAE